MQFFEGCTVRCDDVPLLRWPNIMLAIPPKKFLDSFLPKDPHVPFSSTFEPGIHSGLKDMDSEADMYTKFVSPNTHHD